MTPKTYATLKGIVYSYWDDILNDRGNLCRGLNKYYKNLTRGSGKVIIPKDKQTEYIQALNAMDAYGVFTLNLVEDISEDFDPTGDICYAISNFNRERFIDFCFKFKIDLGVNAKLHTVKLAIGDDNIPIVTIDGNKRYAYKKQYESNFLRILKIALAYNRRELTVDNIKELCQKTDIQNSVLGGQELRLIGKTDIRRDFSRKSNFPSNLLEDFFTILSNSIVGRATITVDDDRLKKILEGSTLL